MKVERENEAGRTEGLAGRCGTYCGECAFRERGKCPGCVKADGKVFWGECELAKCCLAKALDHCGLCAEFPCATLKRYAYDPKHGDNGARIRNLEQWRAVGVERWLAERGRSGPL